MNLIVQKYGGASLGSIEKLGAIARRIADSSAAGLCPVIVVSAMGDKTNELIRKARTLHAQPDLRGIDALLATGEMESAALMSIALNAIGFPAQCMSGQQAGIFTDSLFSNAAIESIDTAKLKALLERGITPVVTGFQGVSNSGETTTLGRGGSDTSAIAIAAALGASRCEILKDVPSVFTADPRLVPGAYPVSFLSYTELLDMTFWGAKMLHYRSVEIAEHFKTEIYVGPAEGVGRGTLIKELAMLEDSRILAVNSHESVVRLRTTCRSLAAGIQTIQGYLTTARIQFPQLLHSEMREDFAEFFFTGPKETLEQIAQIAGDHLQIDELASVSATCRGATHSALIMDIVSALDSRRIKISSLFIGAMSLTVFVEQAVRQLAANVLHSFVELGDQKRLSSV